MALAFVLTEQPGNSNGDDVFEGRAFGTASADRWIVVSFTCNATSISGVNIGGVSASYVHDGTLGVGFGLAWANVPTGTTGDVEVVGSAGGMILHGIWAVTGSASINKVDHDFNVTLTNWSFSINVGAGGVTLASFLDGGGAGTVLWDTGLTASGTRYLINAGANAGQSGATLNASTTSLSCSVSGSTGPLTWAVSFEPVAAAPKSHPIFRRRTRFFRKAA